MKLGRIPTIHEEKLVEFLLTKSSIEFPINWKDHLLLEPMDDGEWVVFVYFHMVLFKKIANLVNSFPNISLQTKKV